MFHAVTVHFLIALSARALRLAHTLAITLIAVSIISCPFFIVFAKFLQIDNFNFLFSFLLILLYMPCVSLLRTWVARFKRSLYSLVTTCRTIMVYLLVILLMMCVCGEKI